MGGFMRRQSRKKVISTTLCAGLMVLSANAFGANWFQLQGTEPEGAEQLAKVWGFVQVQYQDDASDPNPGGGYIPPKLIQPNWQSQSAFHTNW